MAPNRWFDMGRLFTVIFFVLSAATLCVCDDDDDDGAECFYEIQTIGQITYLGSFNCEYGCCGTTENQRCCTKSERFKDYKQGVAWRIAGIVIVCILAVILIALVVACIMKKKNKKKMLVYDIQSHASRNGNGFSTLGGQPSGSGATPPCLTQKAAFPEAMPPPAYTFTAPSIREENMTNTGITPPENPTAPPGPPTSPPPAYSV